MPPPASAPLLIDAQGLGVHYTSGTRRDDLQSLTYRRFQRGRTRTPQWALQDVTFTAHAGEIVGIVGMNGAGKSTLCRVLSGILRPDAGTLSVRGDTSALLALGTGFNKELSGRENIVLNGLMLGLAAGTIETLLPDIVGFSGLARFVDEPLKHYSSGMRARLAFSVAAMLEPSILILDETLSTGDLEFTAKAGEKLQTLIDRARMVIVATHQLDFAERHCAKVLWLHRGRVEALGRPDEVLPRYRDAVPSRRTSWSTSPPAPRERTTQRPVVEAKDISVGYRLQGPGKAPFRALDGVSLTVHEGESVGIIGANGAGKTTLCRILTGLLRPDDGALTIDGKVSALLTLRAGMNDQLPGRDNVYLGGMVLGRRKRDVHETFDEILEFSGLGEAIDRPVKHYSQGMRARLGFSVATSIEPDILVIDEALSAGDAAFQEKASARMSELIAQAKAVIVVTHNLSFVTTFCTRAVWLEQGRVAFDGPTAEAVKRYRQARGVPDESSPNRPPTMKGALRRDVTK